MAGRKVDEGMAAAVIDRAHMVRAAHVALAAQSGKDMVPILGNMLIEGAGDTLALTGTDMDIAVRLTVPARCEGAPLETTVAAKRLSTLVGSSDDECDIRLTLSPGAREMEMRAGRSRYRLPVLPRADFPLIAFEEGGAGFTVPAAALGAALGRAAFAESSNASRYYLCGTALVADGGEMAAVATDGNILARVVIGEAVTGWETVILPSKLTALMVRLLKEGAGDVDVAIDAKGKRIRFEWGPWTITSKLVDGTFPAVWSQVIPAPDAARQVTADSGAVGRAIRRIGEMAEAKTRIVEMTVGADQLVLRCQSVEAGFGEEEIPAVGGGEPMVLRFVDRQLREIVDAASGDSVRLTLGADGRANVRVEPEVGGGFVGVLQPLNL